MQIEVKDIEYCRVNVNFQSDPEQVENKRYEIINQLRDRDIPGFRKGKATDQAIIHNFKDKIEEALKNEMAQEAFYTVIAEKNLRPFGNPQFISADIKDKKFDCSFILNTIPDFELKEYKGFVIPKPDLPETNEMSEKILQELRNRNGETTPFTENDFLQKGDAAIINYTCFDGDAEVHKVDGELFNVGQSSLLGFNTNLLGMKVGETRDFIEKIPDNATNSLLRNKDIKFVVELMMASKNEPAALDDNLAFKVGAKNIDELTKLTYSTATARLQQLERNHLAQQVSSRLIEVHNFEMPNWLVEFEAKLIAKNNGEEWGNLQNDDKVKYMNGASANVRLSLILDKIRSAEPDAQLTDKEIVEIIKTKYLKNEDPKSLKETFEKLSENGQLSMMASHIKDEFVIDFVIKNSTIQE